MKTTGSIRRFFYSFLRAPINFLFNFWERGESVICIIEHIGTFLFVRNSNYPALWAFPGGRVKKNESPADAVMREVREETGIILQDPELFGEQTSEKRGKVISRTSCFHAKVENQALKLDTGEILEAQWFGLGNIPQSQSLTTKRAVELFKKFKKT